MAAAVETITLPTIGNVPDVISPTSLAEDRVSSARRRTPMVEAAVVSVRASVEALAVAEEEVEEEEAVEVLAVAAAVVAVEVAVEVAETGVFLKTTQQSRIKKLLSTSRVL